MAISNMQGAVLQTQKRRIIQKIFAEFESRLQSPLGAKIALAISGGLDSRALLEAVARWPGRFKSMFFVLTVNHNLRPESAAEARAVVSRAKVLGFDAEVLSIFVGEKKDEATLRTARYSIMWNFLEAREIRVLCTAHQKDDNAEGVFMDLFGLGGGVQGAGMEPKRCDSFGMLVRPFLNLERKDLLLFLTSIGVTDYFNDPSNQNGSCSRQKARDFLRFQAPKLHPSPIKRLALVAEKRSQEQAILSKITLPPFLERGKSIHFRISYEMPAALLRRALEARYKDLCPELDPRNAAPGIENVVKKAQGLGLIKAGGVDPAANSITLTSPVRLNFDLPGAKVLMTPVSVSLSR